MARKKLDQRGAVSFLSVIIFTIIISVIILAYMQSAALQQRNANNYDYSTRAYYAAESGAQDAIRAFRANPTDKSDCEPAPLNPSGTIGDSDAYGLSYTCQLIRTNVTAVNGDLTPNGGTAMIRLDNSGVSLPSRYRLIIRWTPSTTNPSDTTYARPVAASGQLPQFDDWHVSGNTNQPFHAMLRMSLIKSPKGSVPITPGSVTQRVLFLNPVENGTGNFSINPSANMADQQEQLISNARCATDSANIPSGGVPSYNNFACVASFTLDNNTAGYGFSDRAVYLRLSTLYRATSFSVSLANNSNPSLNVYTLNNIQATVDVTGKAGNNVYRRVQQNIALDGGYAIDTEPDAALIGAEGICKQFSLGTGPSTFINDPNKCNPLE